MTRSPTSGGFYRYILENERSNINVFPLKATPERKEKKYPELDQLEAELVAARYIKTFKIPVIDLNHFSFSPERRRGKRKLRNACKWLNLLMQRRERRRK